MTAIPDLPAAASLLAGPDAARRLFDLALAGIRRDAGSGLSTASVYDLGAMRSRRVYSDDEAAYPVGNFKRLDRNLYYRTVIEACRPFASTRIEEIAEVFFDWEKIRDLGFESNLNIPAVVAGRVIGTVNLLGPAGHYTPQVVARALAWQPVVTLAFLAFHAGDIETDTFTGHRSSAVVGLEGLAGA